MPLAESSVEIVVPAFNEAERLARGFGELRTWLDGNGLSAVRICIAENGSRDATPQIADALAGRYVGTRVVHLANPGLAEALRQAWRGSTAEILGYCDADMSTALEHIPEALNLLRENPDCVLVSGSRRLPESCVRGRNLRRKIVSRVYADCVRVALGTHFSDSACGFKFLRNSWLKSIAENLVSEKFTLGAELALLAERRCPGGLKELPVRWEERTGSRIRLLPAIFGSVSDILKIRRHHLRN